jgi:carbohydrate-selective porin OprB
LAYKQQLFGDLMEFTVGRLAFGDQFFSYPCDFINLTFCPGQPGNLVGDYIYNWPVSQWAAAGQLNFGSQGYFKIGVYDSSTSRLEGSRGLYVDFTTLGRCRSQTNRRMISRCLPRHSVPKHPTTLHTYV